MSSANSPNNFSSSTPPATPISLELDRLVDGSLGEEARHRLLLKLDQETNGWKQCALAFLEAQTFRDAMGPLLNLPDQAKQSVTDSHHPLSPDHFSTMAPKPASTYRIPGTLLGMAASAALAFGAGWWANSPPANTTDPSIAQARNSSSEPGPTEKTQPAASGTEPQNANPDLNNPSVGSTTVLAQNSEADSSIQEKPEKQKKQLEALRHLSDTLRLLEKKGYTANMHNEILSIKTADGRKVELPVQELVLKYRGKQTY